MNTSVVNSQEPDKATLLLSFRDKYDLNTIFDFTEDAKTGSDFYLPVSKSLRSRKSFVLAKPSNFRMHSRHHCLLIAINENHEAVTFWKSIDKNNNTYEPP